MEAPDGARRDLEASCRSLWRRRTAILQRLGADASVRHDLLDLAVFGGDLGVSLAAEHEKNAARRAALRVLDEAEELFGPSPVLLHRREVHAARAGLTERARAAAVRRSRMAPASAWEHLSLGRSLLEAGEARTALAHFDRALALEPGNLWPNFCKGVCSCQLGEFPDAVVAFSVCIGLAPASAACYCNRASAYVGCRQPEKALRDYDRALLLEPTLAVAALHRGRLHLEQQRFPEALDDLEKALRGGVDRAAAARDIARVKLAQGERGNANP
jgi:tetratricopeptide (TPR) repeat protein